MKLFIKILILFFCPFFVVAQGQIDNEGMNLPLSVFVPSFDSGKDGRATSYLQSKLQQYVSEISIGKTFDEYSFVVYPKIDIINSEITNTIPQMYLKEFEVTFLVTNVTPASEDSEAKTNDRILFHSFSIALKGLDKSENKAYMNAFENISAHKREIKDFLIESKSKIKLYYHENCDAILEDALMMAREANLSINNGKSQNDKIGRAEAKFANGLNILKNLRIANTDCYESQTEKINQILDMYDDFACRNYLALAKNHWAVRDVENTIKFLDMIPPSQKCKDEVEVVLQDISKYIDDPERNISKKILLWKEAGGSDKARIEAEAYKYLQTATMEVRRMDAQSISNKDLLILK